MAEINLPFILLASVLTSASPGPATLTIAGTSMNSGRTAGLALALGVLTGSVSWSILAAVGFSALMQANAWTFEVMRYLGAGYLLFLAWKSARSAIAGARAKMETARQLTPRIAYAKGLALHLTNPKPILFFGSLFAIGVPMGTPTPDILRVIATIAALNTCVFLGYAMLFSSAPMVAIYARLKRGFEATFALLFGAAAIKILTTR
ncbi:MAG: LysE family transporter [Proteobacteria bacterium]|nr:LysE family transporter [Pseudomonadota bacterium]